MCHRDAMVLNDFYDSRPAKAGQHLRILMLATTLGNVQGIAHVVLYSLGELSQVFEARSDPSHRL
jgi:hypothetical protein